jgi:hypothetical protein
MDEIKAYRVGKETPLIGKFLVAIFTSPQNFNAGGGKIACD